MKKFIVSIAFVAAVVVPASADDLRPNREEFLQWVAPGYVYMCTVRLQSGSLSLRASPGGRKIGSLPNGYEFDLGDVRATSNGRNWYLVNPYYGRKEKGWVASDYVTCDSEHIG